VPAALPHAPTRSIAGPPPALTRVVTLGLVVVAGAVVLSATNEKSTVPSAEVAADSQVTVIDTATIPTDVALRGIQRNGDALLLRVDPVGAGGSRNVILTPGAAVAGNRELPGLGTASGVPLSRLLIALSDPRTAAPLRGVTFRLTYDANGEVSALTAE